MVRRLRRSTPIAAGSCAARGGIPTDESQWQTLDTDTDSPFTHLTNETTPITFAYRARHIGKHLKHGSFCDPVVCTVSV